MPSSLLKTHSKALAVLAATLLMLTLACGGADETDEADRGIERVWEAWRTIDESYANREDLDTSQVVSGALLRILYLAEGAPYPFLTKIGRVRGQVPPEVPAPMADLWRGLALHQQDWPETEEAELMSAAIDGMVRGLGDPNTVFLEAEDYPKTKEAVSAAREGSYVGIGAQVLEQEGQIVLIPMEGEPAARFGVEPGDVLLAVEGQPVADRSIEDIVAQVKGEEGVSRGTKITLQVERMGEPEPLDLDVFRDLVDRPSISRQLVPGGIGYLYIATFRDNTGAQVFDALEELTDTGIDMLALILDLRSTTGGSAEGSDDVAGQFLAPGSLFIYTLDQQGARTDRNIREDLERFDLVDIPVAVLVDRETSGEAEALAAVLQETGRGVVIGEETAGSGGAYEFVELGDGSAIYMPTRRWYTSAGKAVGQQGLAPDIRVGSKPAVDGLTEDSQFNRAYDYLNDLLPPFR